MPRPSGERCASGTLPLLRAWPAATARGNTWCALRAGGGGCRMRGEMRNAAARGETHGRRESRKRTAAEGVELWAGDTIVNTEGRGRAV